MGYSVARWEGDTLVVQTTGFKEEGWLDNAGHPRGHSMRSPSVSIAAISGTSNSKSAAKIRSITRGLLLTRLH
jgi:hypothetical protein